jgi:hypothetical protein
VKCGQRSAQYPRQKLFAQAGIKGVIGERYSLVGCVVLRLCLRGLRHQRQHQQASIATTTTTLTRFGMTNMLIPPVELADESLEHLAKILRQQAPWEDESLFDRSAQKDSGVRKKEHL